MCLFAEYNDIAGTDAEKAHTAKYKDNIDSVMQSQFSDIVEEVSFISLWCSDTNTS